jgi:hypothetical protein
VKLTVPSEVSSPIHRLPNPSSGVLFFALTVNGASASANSSIGLFPRAPGIVAGAVSGSADRLLHRQCTVCLGDVNNLSKGGAVHGFLSARMASRRVPVPRHCPCIHSRKGLTVCSCVRRQRLRRIAMTGGISQAGCRSVHRISGGGCAFVIDNSLQRFVMTNKNADARIWALRFY